MAAACRNARLPGPGRRSHAQGITNLSPPPPLLILTPNPSVLPRGRSTVRPGHQAAEWASQGPAQDRCAASRAQPINVTVKVVERRT